MSLGFGLGCVRGYYLLISFVCVTFVSAAVWALLAAISRVSREFVSGVVWVL